MRCFFLLATVTLVHPADCTFRIEGSGVPIAGIRIKLEPSGATAVSEADGKVQLRGIDEGVYLLTAAGRGFVPVQIPLAVPAACAELKVSMEPTFPF